MLDDTYAIRPISISDAATVALHRSLMFRDMGVLDEAEAEQLRKTSEPWIEGLLLEGTYVGWFVEFKGAVVGGCGLHLSTFGPKPGFTDGGKSAHVANVYIDSVYRRRGLADELMAVTLQWARTQKVDEITLSASDQAKPLYKQPWLHARRSSPCSEALSGSLLIAMNRVSDMHPLADFASWAQSKATRSLAGVSGVSRYLFPALSRQSNRRLQARTKKHSIED